MNGKVLLVGLAVVAGVAAALRMVAWAVQQRPPRAEPSLTEPRPLVRILHTDDELRAAVERSLRGERPAHEALRRRLDRYASACHDPHGPNTIRLSRATDAAIDDVDVGRRSA